MLAWSMPWGSVDPFPISRSVSLVDDGDDDGENEQSDESRTDGESHRTVHSGTHEDGHHRRDE